MSARANTAPPSPIFTLLESRAVSELGAFFAASPLLRLVGRGDRHPVLVLPGFTAGDRSTEPLRALLRAQGYWTHGWGMGRNLGPSPAVIDGLIERLTSIHDRHDRTVSIIGWSLGGIYARELARNFPDRVREVITLGSPFRMTETDRSAASALYERLQSGRRHERPLRPADREAIDLTVPSTAIYTRTDGVVRWFQCLESEGPNRENIEVRGSHSGLGHNPAAVYAVLDRLAQPEGDWRPFEAPIFARRWFPRPETWTAQSA